MIVDNSYFEAYKGSSVDNFDRLNGISQSFVEYLTRKSESELLELPEAILKKVKDAICAEIDYLDSLGGTITVNSKQDLQKTSESYAGSYSYTVDSKNIATVEFVNGLPKAPLIEIYLGTTGLLYAGVDYVF